MSLLSRLLFPPKCASCRVRLPFDEERALCPDCAKRWQEETLDDCGFCHKRVGECRCSTELMRKSGCPVLFKLAYYKPGSDAPQNRMLFKMKASASPCLYTFVASRLAEGIAAYLAEEKIARADCLVAYAPRSRRASVESGVDQAKLLAARLAGELGVEQVRAIERLRGKNRQQKELTPPERLQNAKESFGARRGVDLSGKTLLLVDDTVTTGATMVTCAKLLRRLGARRVLSVALTMDEVGRYPKEPLFDTKPYF